MTGLLAVLLYLLCRGLIRRRIRSTLLWMGLAAVLFVTGAGRITAAERLRKQVLEQVSDGDFVTIRGEISKKQIKEEQCIYELTDCCVMLSGEAVSCGNVLVPLSENDYSIRTILILTGQVNTFYYAVNDGNFDQRAYYQSLGIDFELDDAEVTAVYGKDGGYREQLYQIKIRLQEVLYDITEEETAGILSGMILGEKSQLDAEIKSLYQKVGISHILAISGLHISVFAAGVYHLLRKRGAGFWLSGLGGGWFALSYVCLTGAGVSAVRAGCMYLLFMMAGMVRRTYDLLNGLGCSVLLMLWCNPFLVGYSGFWFSLAAMLGIGCAVRALTDETQRERADIASGRIRAWLHRQQFRKRIKDAIASGVGIQAATLPMVALFYYEVPVYATLVNLLAVPFLTSVLLSGAAGMLAGYFSPDIGAVGIYPAHLILKGYRRICEIVLQWPGAQKITGKPELYEIICYYGILAAALYLYTILKKKSSEKNSITESKDKPANEAAQKKHRGFWIYPVILLLALWFCRCRTPEPEVDYLDVGQGDGIFISCGDGFCCFIDGGSSDVSSVGSYRILPFLKAKGADHVDYWFISHADSDHVSGVTEVLASGYEVEHLVFSYAVPRDDAWEELCEAAEAVGTKLLYMNEGDQLIMGEAEWTCLYPFAGMTEAEINTEDVDRNTRSLVLQMELCGTDFLFVGDISSEQEQELLGKYPEITADIYKVAHHGSNYSSCEEFLNVLLPGAAVISCSSTNSYGHPGAETVARLEALENTMIYYTMQGGRIRVIPGENYGISEFLITDK